uniref:MIF4G domain-containing protein n=1 Tax=Lotharella globosa TaxID=91324 RepID=A0A7S3YAL9_9EUKA
MTHSPNVLNGLTSKHPSQGALRSSSGQVNGSRNGNRSPYAISNNPEAKYASIPAMQHILANHKVPDRDAPAFYPGYNVHVGHVNMKKGMSHVRVPYRQSSKAGKGPRNEGSQHTQIYKMVDGSRAGGRGRRSMRGRRGHSNAQADRSKQTNHQHFNPSVHIHYPSNLVPQQHQQHLQRVIPIQQSQQQHHTHQPQQANQMPIRLVSAQGYGGTHGLVRPVIATSGVQPRMMQVNSGKISHQHQGIIQMPHQHHQIRYDQHTILQSHQINPTQFYPTKSMQGGQIQIAGGIIAPMHPQMIQQQQQAMQSYQDQTKYGEQRQQTRAAPKAPSSLPSRALQIINPKSGKPIDLTSGRSVKEVDSRNPSPVDKASDFNTARTPAKESVLKAAILETAEKKAVESKLDDGEDDLPRIECPSISEEKAKKTDAFLRLKSENCKVERKEAKKPLAEIPKPEASKTDNDPLKEQPRPEAFKKCENFKKEVDEQRNESVKRECAKGESARLVDEIQVVQASEGEKQQQQQHKDNAASESGEKDGKSAQESKETQSSGSAAAQQNGDGEKPEASGNKENSGRPGQGNGNDNPNKAGDDSQGGDEPLGPYMPRPIKQNRVSKRKKITFTREQLMSFQSKCEDIPKGFPTDLMKEITAPLTASPSPYFTPRQTSSSNDIPEVKLTPTEAEKPLVVSNNTPVKTASVPTKPEKSAKPAKPPLVKPVVKPQGRSSALDRPLAKSANRWQPSSKKMTVLQLLMQKVMGILNKLSPEEGKHEGLFEQLFDLVKHHCRTAEDLVGICNQVFDKAVTEHGYAALYAKLCIELSTRCPSFRVEKVLPNGRKIVRQAAFQTILLTKCEKEFEGKSKQTLSLMEKITKATDPDIKDILTVKLKKRRQGNIRFMGELYKAKLMANRMERILHLCIQRLLRDIKNPSEEDIVCLEVLLVTVGKQLDVPKAQKFMNTYFKRITNMAVNPKLPMRLKFKCQDLMDLRRRNWSKKGDRVIVRKPTTVVRGVGVPRRPNSILSRPDPRPTALPRQLGNRYGDFGSAIAAPAPKATPQVIVKSTPVSVPAAIKSATPKTSPEVPGSKKSVKKDVSFDLTPVNSPNKVEKDIVSLIDEYFGGGGKAARDEAALCITELKSPSSHWMVTVSASWLYNILITVAESGCEASDHTES